MNENGTTKNNEDQEGVAAWKPLILAPGREPTIKEWQVLLDYAAEAEPHIVLIIQLLMLNTETGREYLEYVTRYRLELREDPLDFMLLITTCDALELLNRLLKEPRFGTDPDFLVWKDVWKNEDADTDEYGYLITLAQGMEDQATIEEERARLRAVREALERELRGEEYIEQKERLRRELQGER